MSRTHAAQQGRKSRQISRDYRDAVNSGDFEREQELFREKRGMSTGNYRYGNHRKWKAAEKVRDRREDRRDRKAEESKQLNDWVQ
jgi:hypothetical protein